jgi:hypothetical protein
LDADALYNSTMTALISSVASGSLLSALQSALSSDMVEGMGLEPLNSESFSALVVLLQQRTAYPTPAPTAAPTAPTAAPAGSSSSGPSFALLGGVVAGALLLLCLVFAAGWFCSRQVLILGFNHILLL